MKQALNNEVKYCQDCMYRIAQVCDPRIIDDVLEVLKCKHKSKWIKMEVMGSEEKLKI